MQSAQILASLSPLTVTHFPGKSVSRGVTYLCFQPVWLPGWGGAPSIKTSRVFVTQHDITTRLAFTVQLYQQKNQISRLSHFLASLQTYIDPLHQTSSKYGPVHHHRVEEWQGLHQCKLHVQQQHQRANMRGLWSKYGIDPTSTIPRYWSLLLFLVKF